MKDNNFKQTLLSIAIPTKDRYECLKYFLQSVDSFKCDEIEVVINDNTSDNACFLEFLNSNNFNFLKYFHISEPISMSQNCDEAISHCSGKYVCLMGDDDFVTKELIDYVRYMDKRGIDAASFSERAHFSWPGVKYVRHQIPNLFIPHFTGKERPIYGAKGIKKLISHGAAELKWVPKLYHAVVLKDRVDEIMNCIGTCFPGESPDIAVGIALSFVVKKAVVCDIPFIVSGTVPKSAGGMGAAHTHNSCIEDVPWLSKSAKEKWDKRVPAIWTGTTVYADTALKTLDAFGKREFLARFNYSYSYAFTLVFEDGCYPYVKAVIGKSIFKWIKVFAYSIGIFFYRAYHYIQNVRIHKIGLTRSIKSNKPNNSFEASLEVSKIISSKSKKFFEYD